MVMTFEKLAANIARVNEQAGNSARTAVNQMMTIRNWMIGYYIVEFEQNGENRAEYGAKLLKELEDKVGIKGLNVTLFQLCRLFYKRYPQIYATVSHKFNLSDSISKVVTETRQFETDSTELISKLSFSHLREIMKIEDSF